MKIVIPGWLKRENPIAAEFCELINEALVINPTMTLAEFAEQISQVNIEDSYKRLQAVERKQFGEEK